MISKLKATGLLWPAVFAIPAFFVLIGLGNWQWQRMHWKEGLLRDLKAASSAAPVPLRDVGQLLSSTASLADIEVQRFRRVSVQGTFEHAYEMHVWAPAKTPAWSVVTPLRLAPGETGPGDATKRASHILVIRGTVPDAVKDARRRRAGQVEGIQTITGRIRLDQPNAWANAPDIAKNQWFTRDLARMRAHLAKKLDAKATMAPIFLEAEQQAGGAQAPKPDLKALSLANRHLEYALTWWGLAATLLGVFAVFASGRINKAG
jgi:surfeit locus 1 family protein